MRIGIDLGGSKIEGIVLAGDGSEIVRHRVPTPTDHYDQSLKAIADLIDYLEAHSPASEETSVGIGIPGAISPASGLVKNANSTCLIGHPLDRDLEALLGRPVRVANDADCFAMSESVDGAGAGHNIVFGVIIGTGVGGGLVVNGELLNGPNAISGEWGHNPLPWPKVVDGVDERPGPACYCGRKGCIETFLSGPGLSRDLATRTGSKLPAPDIIASVESGDAEAIDALRRYEHRLARALASVINVVDPDIIVLGGGLSNIDALYANVPQLWQQWVFSDRCDTLLRRNIHGDSSGVRGAAWLWPG